jgi:hypothetical protein
VLLAFWQHFFFFLALEVGQFLDSFADDLEGGLDLVLRDDERRCQTDDVLVSGFGLGREKESVSVRSVKGVFDVVVTTSAPTPT